jgi:hypothetical protein
MEDFFNVKSGGTDMISGFHGGDYEECRLLGYKNPIRTSQETYYISTTEPNRLMLCGETVAVCCENRAEHTDTVRTSQETHHVSTQSPTG